MLRLLLAARFQRHIGWRYASSSAFTEAQAKLNTLTNEPNNEIKLKLYAYFKQATVGPCTLKKPGMLDFVAKAKWDAWSALEGMEKGEAEAEYTKVVEALLEKEFGGKGTEEKSDSMEGENQDLLIASKDGVLSIALNRPRKLNALTLQMYKDITSALTRANSDDSVRVCTLTASGDYYSSGNDLGNFIDIAPDKAQERVKEGGEILKAFVDSMITCTKPLVAIVNGPALGIMVTTLGLCDMVFASDKATFHTPFAETAQTPEGCSSFLFPRLMGIGKANEVLLLSRKLTAQEAVERNLVTAVFSDENFREEAGKRVQKLASSPPNMIAASKQVIRDSFVPLLLDANKRECEVLMKQWTSNEFLDAMMKFVNRKK